MKIGGMLMTSTAPLRFETLLEQHHDEIYAYLWRMLAGSGSADRAADAQDVTQEVFLRAYRAYGRLRPNSNARAWLYKIATNCAYTLLKRGQHRDVPLLDEVDHVLDESVLLPETQVVLGEALDSLRVAIGALPTRQRAALVMRYLQELDYSDIAQALACSEDSVRANVYQAIRRLRREMGDE